MIKRPTRSQIREYIRNAMNEMVRAENDADPERIKSTARNIEHLARELREHAESYGNFG